MADWVASHGSHSPLSEARNEKKKYKKIVNILAEMKTKTQRDEDKNSR